MKKLTYEILRKHIPTVSLISLTSKNWKAENNGIVSWTGTTYIGPATGDVVYNTNETSPLIKGYYKWNGTTWVVTSKANAYDSYNIPLFLEANAEELGIMVGFDGDIEQEDKECNFVYTSTGNTVTVWNTTSTNRLKRIVDASFTINWGDGTTSPITNLLEHVNKTYASPGEKTISIVMSTSWTTQTTTKKIVLPKDISDPTDLLNFTYTGGTLHYYDLTSQDYLKSGSTQNYGKSSQYEYNGSSFTGTTTFLALGKSRVIEKKLYGGNNYSGLTTGTTTIHGVAYSYTGYSIDDLSYLDLSDGSTYITGNTASFTSEAQFTKCLTRNEHYLGFVSDPIIYSDIFVERGKMGVSEFNLRLGEIDNLGELEIYGNGFFNVKNQ